MNGDGLAYETFRSAGREEYLMRVGPVEAPPILIVPPLFEEMNRTRALIAGVMRALAGRGMAGWLPDLTGTGESLEALGTTRWEDWRHDVMAAADHLQARSGKTPLIASIRGGCLIDDGAAAIGWWRLAPVPGASLVRDMTRAGLAGVEWAGYAPSDSLRGRLADAAAVQQEPLRTARLSSDAAPADIKLSGPALWRRSEPGSAPELAEAMAADIVEWHAACAVS